MTLPADRDSGLDALLFLDGDVFVIDPSGGHWVKFEVKRVDVTMPILWQLGQGRERRKPRSMITGTGCERSNPMTTGMPPVYWRTSGTKLRPYWLSEE
jgi:hypothetical protein